MNKLDAKRHACHAAAAVIQNALDSGWETDAWFKNEADERRFTDALADVIAELARRGERRGPRS